MEFVVRAPQSWHDGHLRKVRIWWGIPTTTSSALAIAYKLGVLSSGDTETAAIPTSGAGFKDSTITIPNPTTQDRILQTEIDIPDANGNNGGIFYNLIPDSTSDLIHVRFEREGTAGDDSLTQIFKLLGIDLIYESIGPYFGNWIRFDTGDISVANDTFAHGAGSNLLNVTGAGPVRIWNTTSDPPDPLQTDTDYWVINHASGLLRLATSKTNATALTQIDILDTGSGSTFIGGAYHISQDEI